MTRFLNILAATFCVLLLVPLSAAGCRPSSTVVHAPTPNPVIRVPVANRTMLDFDGASMAVVLNRMADIDALIASLIDTWQQAAYVDEWDSSLNPHRDQSYRASLRALQTQLHSLNVDFAKHVIVLYNHVEATTGGIIEPQAPICEHREVTLPIRIDTTNALLTALDPRRFIYLIPRGLQTVTIAPTARPSIVVKIPHHRHIDSMHLVKTR